MQELHATKMQDLLRCNMQTYPRSLVGNTGPADICTHRYVYMCTCLRAYLPPYPSSPLHSISPPQLTPPRHLTILTAPIPLPTPPPALHRPLRCHGLGPLRPSPTWDMAHFDSRWGMECGCSPLTYGCLAVAGCVTQSVVEV